MKTQSVSKAETALITNCIIQTMRKHAIDVGNTELLLTGGAILHQFDASGGVKDYDFTEWSDGLKKLMDKTYFRMYKSKYAYTYFVQGKEVQLIIKSKEQFVWTIVRDNFYKVVPQVLVTSPDLFTYQLIPTDIHNKQLVVEGLALIPKWKGKGYSMNMKIYRAMLEQVSGLKVGPLNS